MRSLIFLKVVLTLFCLEAVALASDYSLQYVVQDDQIKTWPSKNDWHQSFQEFLSNEQKVQEYVQKKEHYKIKYNNKIEEYEKKYEGKKKKYEAEKQYAEKFCIAAAFAIGGFMALYAGVDTLISESTVLSRDINKLVNAVTLAGGGAGIPSAFFAYLFLAPRPRAFPKKSVHKESLEDTLQRNLKRDIKDELRLYGYLTNSGYYPNNTKAEGAELIKNFINAVLQKSS